MTAKPNELIKIINRRGTEGKSVSIFILKCPEIKSYLNKSLRIIFCLFH